MNLFPKKFIASVLTIIMCISSISFVGAENSGAITISASGTTTINTASDMECLNGVANYNGSGNYGFCTGAYATATIDVLETGYYTLEISGDVRSAKTATYDLFVDDTVAAELQMWGNGDGIYTVEAADVYLTEGEHTLKLAYKAPASVYNYLTELKFTKKANDTKSIWVLAKTGTAVKSSGAAHDMLYLSNGGTATFKVIADEAGVYDMSMKVARTDALLSNYNILVNNVPVTSEKQAIPAHDANIEPFYKTQIMAPMCQVELNEGENTITFENNSTFMYFSYFKFDLSTDDSQVESNGIKISAEGTTEISFDDAVSIGTDTGDGHYKFYGESFATVAVNVEETGYYTMGVNILTRDQYKNGWEVYVDDKLEDSFPTFIGAPVWYNNEAVDLYLTEGEHFIKIKCTNGNAYNDGFTLTRKDRDVKAMWIEGSSATGTGTPKWERYQLSNSNNVQQYADYNVNVDKAGTYKVSIQHSYNNSVINSAILSVNGVEKVTASLPALQRGTYGDEHKITVLGDVELQEGTNTLRIKNKDLPNGADFFISRVKVELISEGLATPGPSEPIGDPIRIPMNSYVEAHNARSGAPSSSKLDIEGDFVCFRSGDWAKFNVDIETPGRYQLGIKHGGMPGESQGLKVSVNGSTQIDTSVEIIPDYFMPGDALIGDVSFIQSGINELKIEHTGGSSGEYVVDLYLVLVEVSTIPTPAPTLAPTPEPTEVPAMGENIRIHMRDYIAAYYATENKNALGQDGSNPDNTLWRVGDWAEYKLNIGTPGTYELGLCLGGNAAQVQKLTASVDGVEQLIADVTIADPMGAGIPKFDVVFGNVTFQTTGEHILKIKKTDGGFIYSSHVFLNLTDSSEIRIPTGSYTEANSSRKPGALDYEGGYYCLRPGDWAKYNVFVATPGKYKLGIKESGNTGQYAKLKASVNGEEQFNNQSKTPLGGMWASFADVEYGEVTFKYSGENTLLIENTGSSDGEYTVDLYLVLVEELDEGANIPDVPETTEIRLHMANDSYDRFCNLTGQDTLKIEGGCVTWHGKDSGSETGDWAKFKVKIDEPGAYRFGLELSGSVGAQTALKVLVNNEEKIPSTSRSIVTYYGTLTDTEFGVLNFDEAGEYDLYVEHTGSAGQYVGHIYLTHLGDDIKVNSIYAGETNVSVETSAPASTDVVIVNFSKKVLDADIVGKNCKITIKDSKGNNIAFSPSVVKASAVLALRETLKEDEVYTISIGDVTDSVENSKLVPETCTFSTYADDGIAFIREAKIEALNKLEHKATATMFSSQNVGIKGRKYEIYLKYPDGTISNEPINKGLSGNDGLIEYAVELPDNSPDGEYSLIIRGEYVKQDASVNFIYVSDSLAERILKALNDASTADEVKKVLEDNKAFLGLDLDKALNGIDGDKALIRFTEKDLTSINEIEPLLNKFISLEKFAQATEENIDDVINDESNWNNLGLNKMLYDCLANADGAQQKAKNEILALDDSLPTDEWISAFLNDIFNVILAESFDKPQDVTLDIKDLSAIAGQGVKLPIMFKEDCTEISEISLVVEVSDDELIENADVELKKSGTYTKEIKDGKLYINIKFDKVVSGDLGNIILIAPNTVSTFDIKVSGELTYLPEAIGLIVKADVLASEIELTTKSKSNTSNEINSSTSTRPSGGGSSRPSGGSSGSTTKPGTTETTFKFSDVASNHWANPAITYLLEKGIIDKTSDKKFYPENAATREEIVKMMVVALGILDNTAKCNFSDVAESNPYYAYIASAAKHGIVKGNDLGEFMIGKSITREDLCVILYRATSKKLTYTKSNELFSDDSIISDYAKDAVYNMRGINIINGIGENQFAPKGNVTKAQAAKMIYEIVKAVK